MYFRRRSGIGRTIAAVIVIVIVLVVAAAAVLSRSSSTTSTSSPSPTTSTTVSPSLSTSTTSTSSAAVGLDVTAMYLQVQGSFQAPSVNVTTIGNNLTTFTGTTNAQFTVTVDISYTNCKGNSCPSQVSQVVACPSLPQPGQTVSCPRAATSSDAFSVEEVEGGQGPPVAANPTGTNSENFIFGVSLQGPSGPYDGNLTLIAAMS